MGITAEELKFVFSGDSAGARAAVADLQTSIAGLAKQHEESFRTIGIAAGAVAGAFVVISAAVVELGQRGADIADVQAQFAVLNTTIGNNATTLQGTLHQAVAGTISDFELMKTTNLGLSQGLQLNEQQFGLTGKAARVLADRVGGDTATAYSNLVMAMSTGQDKLLKQIGLNIDATGAVKAHAESLGVEKEALTENQIIAAKRGAILVEMQRVLGESGEAEVDFADRIAQGRVVFQNMMDDLAVGIAQSPVFAAAMDGIAGAITGTFGGESQGLVKTIISLLEGGAITLIGFGEAGVSVAKFLTEAFYGTRAIFFGIAEAITNVVATVFDAIATTAEYAAKIPGIGDQFAPLAQSFREATDVADAMATSFKATKDEALDSADSTGKAFDGVGAALGGLRTRMADARRTEDDHTASVKTNAAGHVARTVAVGESTEAVKKHTAALAALVDKLSGDAAIGQAMLYLEAVQKTGGVTHLTAKEQEALNGVLSDALQKYAALGEQGPAALMKVWAATAKQPTLVPLAQALRDLPQHITFDPIPASHIAPLFSHLPAGIKSSIAAAKPTITGALTAALSDLPQILQQAFIGGGGVSGAVNALGAKIGGDLFGEKGAFAGATKAATGGLTSMFGKTVGDAFGAAIPGIGALIGPGLQALWGGIQKLFGGPSAIELEGRKVEAAFEQSFGGFQKMMTAIGDVYAATGRSSQMAQADVKAMMDAEVHGADAVKAAVDKINLAFTEQKTFIAESNTALGDLLKAGVDLGVKLPDSLQPAVQKLVDMGKITGDNATLFASLAGSTEVDFKKMESIAGKYGMDLANLGPAFQSAKLGDIAKSVINDFDTLVRGGADTDKVLAGLRKPINDIVTDSLQFGTEIPKNMEPWILQLLKTGQLTDENGDKMTDLAGIQFAPPIVTEFEKILLKIQELIDKIAAPGGVTAAINSIPDKKTVHIGYEYDPYTPPDYGAGNGVDPPGFASGGVLTHEQIIRAREGGEDEIIGPVPFMSRALSGAFRMMGGSAGLAGGAPSLTINAPVTVQGNVLTERDLMEAVSQHIADTYLQLGGAIPLNR